MDVKVLVPQFLAQYPEACYEVEVIRKKSIQSTKIFRGLSLIAALSLVVVAIEFYFLLGPLLIVIIIMLSVAMLNQAGWRDEYEIAYKEVYLDNIIRNGFPLMGYSPKFILQEDTVSKTEIWPDYKGFIIENSMPITGYIRKLAVGLCHCMIKGLRYNSISAEPLHYGLFMSIEGLPDHLNETTIKADAAISKCLGEIEAVWDGKCSLRKGANGLWYLLIANPNPFLKGNIKTSCYNLDELERLSNEVHKCLYLVELLNNYCN